jgi:hypothetical protein
MDSIPATHTWAPQPRLDGQRGVSENGAFDAPKQMSVSTGVTLLNLRQLGGAEKCRTPTVFPSAGKLYPGMNRLFAQYDSPQRSNRHLSQRRNAILQRRVRAEQ